MLTIRKIIENTKAEEHDITGIKVGIQDLNEETETGNPVERYFGSLADIPEAYMEYRIEEMAQVVTSTVEERIGANILKIKM